MQHKKTTHKKRSTSARVTTPTAVHKASDAKHTGGMEVDPTFLPFLGGGGGFNPMGMLGPLLGGGGQGGGQNPMGMLGSLFGGGGGMPFGGGGGNRPPFGGGMGGMPPMMGGRPPQMGGRPPMHPFAGGQGAFPFGGGGMGGMGGMMNPFGMPFGGGGGMGNMGGLPMNFLWNMASRFLW